MTSSAAPMREQAPAAIGGLAARQHATVRGRITAIRVEPLSAAPQVIARVDDGTGAIEAVFMGRRQVSGVEPGAQITVSGMFCVADSALRVYNPRYTLS